MKAASGSALTLVLGGRLALVPFLLTAVMSGPADAAPAAKACQIAREAEAQSPDPRYAEADALARGMVSRGEVPGLALAVVRGGRMVFVEGYGKANLETGTPVTADTVFNIFSVTKTFTAAAVMQLHERGLLGLDDTLSRHLGEFPRGNEVTIKQLLSHRSGLRDYVDSHVLLGRTGATPDELVALIARQPDLFTFEPGAGQAYSNSNYVLLGRIIEKVSGVPYARYLAENVFPSGGMTRTSVDRGGDVVPGRASGYVRVAGAPGAYANFLYDISAPFAAGSVRSTAPDLARWFSALFGGCVVSLESVQAMTSPARSGSGRASASAGGYGLGVRSYVVDGRRALGPGGSWNHFSSKVTRYPDDDMTVIVLANTGGVAADVERRIAGILLRAVQRSAPGSRIEDRRSR